jgi:glycosyltransferase involved in cell wall biosynthesis
MIALHRWRQTWERSVDRFIALSTFARNRFIEAGLPADRIRIKPNFAFDPFPTNNVLSQRAGALYVGRLSHEKGIHILLEAWRTAKIPLTIIGDGPDVEAVRAAQSPTLTYLGTLDSNSIFETMKHSRFLLLPSITYEGFPKVVAEAFASGLPIIAARIGSLEELIDDNYNGYHFNPGDPSDLLRVTSEAFFASEQNDFLSQHARETYERCFTPEHNLRQLSDIYREAIDDARGRAARSKSRTKLGL